MQQGQASDAADFSFYRKSFEGKFRRCSRASCRSISQLGQVVDEDFFLHRRPLGFIGVFFSSPLVQAGFFFASSLLRLALLSSFVRASFLSFLTLRSRFVPGIVVASLARRMGAAGFPFRHRHRFPSAVIYSPPTGVYWGFLSLKNVCFRRFLHGCDS